LAAQRILARDVLKPPLDSDHLVVQPSQPRMKRTAPSARFCPQAFPQPSKTVAPAAGALTCPGLAPGFACSCTRTTWGQHATCLPVPKRAARGKVSKAPQSRRVKFRD